MHGTARDVKIRIPLEANPPIFHRNDACGELWKQLARSIKNLQASLPSAVLARKKIYPLVMTNIAIAHGHL